MMETIFINDRVHIDQPDYSSPFFTSLGKKNIVCLTSPKNYLHHKFTGTLSLKSTFSGEEHYKVDNAFFKVKPGSYLLLNNGQEYANFVKSSEDFTIFFGHNFIENILYSFVTDAETLLDNIYEDQSDKINFFQTLDHKTPKMVYLLYKIKNLFLKNKPGMTGTVNDFIYELALEILNHQKNIIVEKVQHLSAAKKITRVELYRRVSRAKDYMQSCIDEEIDLKKLSQISNLSIYHFLRIFKEAYVLTPHQFLMQQRFLKAKHLLKYSSLAPSEISAKVGFKDVTSFYKAFSAKENMPPGCFRINSRFYQSITGNKNYFA